MGVPKKPNTTAASDGRRDAARRRRLDGLAEQLRAAGAEVVMPYALEKTEVHTWRVEFRKADAMPWFIDCYGGERSVWFTLAGGGLRIEELEARGIAARLA
jgi:hypothetical protein